MKALIKKDTFTLVFSTVFSREDIKDCLFLRLILCLLLHLLLFSPILRAVFSPQIKK